LRAGIAGAGDAWQLFDEGGDGPSGGIIWASVSSSSAVAGGAVVKLDLPFAKGLFLRVPPNGVCSVNWAN
jgi:hypothetical protein